VINTLYIETQVDDKMTLYTSNPAGEKLRLLIERDFSSTGVNARQQPSFYSFTGADIPETQEDGYIYFYVIVENIHSYTGGFQLQFMKPDTTYPLSYNINAPSVEAYQHVSGTPLTYYDYTSKGNQTGSSLAHGKWFYATNFTSSGDNKYSEGVYRVKSSIVAAAQ
jgi:hypothetical protein